jgi:hypothetical protein
MPVYVPNFKHDIFVSYSHADNKVMVGAEKGWVTTFINTLKIELGRQLGREDAYSLWMDYKLTGHDLVTPDIDKQLNNCATFLLILSPAYLASEWCTLELNTFFSQVDKDSGRIFMVEHSFIAREDKLPELQELLGYPFWIEDSDTGIRRTMAIPKPNPDREPEYYQKISVLAAQIKNELDQLRDKALVGTTDIDSIAALDKLHLVNEKARLNALRTDKLQQAKSTSVALSKLHVPYATRERLNKQLQQYRMDVDELVVKIGRIDRELGLLEPTPQESTPDAGDDSLAALDKLHFTNEKTRLEAEKADKIKRLKNTSNAMTRPHTSPSSIATLSNQCQQFRSDIEKLTAEIATIDRELKKLS